MKRIVLIGAGQLGSRHLQALKKVKLPLAIYVIDPNPESLKIAKERYASVENSRNSHQVVYQRDFHNLPQAVELGIIATNADVRFQVLEKLLRKSKVKYLVLEKLLFKRKSEYEKALKLVKDKRCRVWVNCSMRTMPFYYDLRKKFQGERINYCVTGSQYGLATNAIHYLDHLVFLTDCHSFSVETKYLDPKIIKSKRKGFLELTGNLVVSFANGSLANIVCFSRGELPVQIVITSSKLGCIIYGPKQEALFYSQKNNWSWQKAQAQILLQSELTTQLVEEILAKGTCSLVLFEQSVATHLALLEPLRKFLNKCGKQKYNYYPFT